MSKVSKPVDVYVIIEGEPFLSRARAYRKAYNAAHDAWREYGLSVGAEQMFGDRHLSGLSFPPGKLPKGWSSPNRRGISWPKKNSEASAAFNALPAVPRSSDVYGDAVIGTLNYTTADGGWGSGCISRFFDMYVGWCGDILVGRIPHAGNAAANDLAEHPYHIIDQRVIDWTVPAGLRMISKAEFELLFAQLAVEQERAASAAA